MMQYIHNQQWPLLQPNCMAMELAILKYDVFFFAPSLLRLPDPYHNPSRLHCPRSHPLRRIARSDEYSGRLDR